MEEYRKVTAGRGADVAQTRIAILNESCMAVETQRVFRSDETPRVGLSTQNVPSGWRTHFPPPHCESVVQGRQSRAVRGMHMKTTSSDPFVTPRHAKSDGQSSPTHTFVQMLPCGPSTQYPELQSFPDEHGWPNPPWTSWK